MYNCKGLLRAIENGECDGRLGELYAPDGDPDRLARARARASGTAARFIDAFSPADDAPAALISGPGRTEIGGNHTDHQRGHVLCGSVDVDILCCTAPNGRDVIRVISQGYPAVEVPLDSLEPREEEKNTSAALVRGVAAGARQRGCALRGFDVYAVSDVLSGSGLSSSAAYETLVGVALNFVCSASLSAIDIAKIGQYAENVYFGKPCGLMDQMGSSVGGAVAVDFEDRDNPAVTPVHYDFARSKHALCIIDTGSCHADLTDDYAAIPLEMRAVAGFFGKEVLREVDEDAFAAALPALRERCGDRAVLRALHYFEDDRRAVEESAALSRGDFSRFLALVNESGLSSALHLQNVSAGGDPRRQAVPVALALAARLLGGRGASRVHGGGFAGTIQAFVPEDMLESFKRGIESALGEGRCHVMRIRPQGGCVVVR